MFRALWCLATWAAMVASAGAAVAQVITPQVVNGLSELGEPTTAALIQGDPATGYVVCSAVLVGCDAAITTAHCFNYNAEQKTTLFLPQAGFLAIESATRHPAYVAALAVYDWDVLRVEDIAFIKLAEPVTGVTPSTLVGAGTPTPGTAGRVVGFGRDPVTELNSFHQNAGIKRSGSMELAACADTLAGQDLLCWDPSWDWPTPPPETGTDVSNCDVDSGGPLFVDESGTRVVAGITKGAVFDGQGQPDLCMPPVQPYDTNVYRHHDWLVGAGGMFETTGAVAPWVKSCSALPQLAEDELAPWPGTCDSTAWNGSDGARTCGFTGELDAAGTSQASHSFDVPSGTTLLRVALNGISHDTGDVDTDFYVRAGAPATTSQFDCKDDGSSTLGFCEFQSPSPGTWYVLVDQPLDQGEYQVTVTYFGPPPPPATVPALAPAAGGVLLLALAVAGRRARRRSSHACDA